MDTTEERCGHRFDVACMCVRYRSRRFGRRGPGFCMDPNTFFQIGTKRMTTSSLVRFRSFLCSSWWELRHALNYSTVWPRKHQTPFNSPTKPKNQIGTLFLHKFERTLLCTLVGSSVVLVATAVPPRGPLFTVKGNRIYSSVQQLD